MSERNRDLTEIERPFSLAVSIIPGKSAILINDEAIIGTTTGEPRRIRLLVGHPNSVFVAREVVDAPGQLKFDKEHTGEEFGVSMEYIEMKNSVYIGEKFKVQPKVIQKNYTEFMLYSTSPFKIKTLEGTIDYRKFLAKLAGR
jgi:hypothetical protein